MKHSQPDGAGLPVRLVEACSAHSSPFIRHDHLIERDLLSTLRAFVEATLIEQDPQDVQLGLSQILVAKTNKCAADSCLNLLQVSGIHEETQELSSSCRISLKSSIP